MNIVITGGAGFLGTLLIQHLLSEADAGKIQLDEVISLDLIPTSVTDPRVRSITGEITDKDTLSQAVTEDTDTIVHLASVLSGGSELDFDSAMHVNIDGTRTLLEAARSIGQLENSPVPRFIFTSSLAVFGGELPQTMPEYWATQPDSTYGATKAICEILVNEYSRKGFIDARVCRLPTISVRPGKPNSAASSFASGIIREPLNGIPSEVPVPHDTLMWLSSPQIAIRNIARAIVIESSRLGSWRIMNLPGISVTVGEMLTSLERVGGSEARALTSDVPNERVASIVTSWPGNFDVKRMEELGFERDQDFDSVIQQYSDDFLS
ncbi:D-erythronate dehydrogenase [Corynebacterium accolens]|uniref:D-erythronate dehydrogenase n=1 Tax=Corynebacterium accolens TaxID=38284 RepID=UPI001EDA1824|nr:D-erythronate dehydrogenase [Corynebacterium accolens]